MPKHHYVIRRLIYDPKITVMETAWHRLALQGGIRAAERMHGRFDNFIAVHSLSFPFECMAAVTGLIFAGLPEKFPKLRIAALEACCGGVPFLMDRLDEEFEKRGAREAPRCIY